MALSGILSFINLKNLHISIETPRDVFAQRNTNFKIKAKNKYFFEAFLIRTKISDSETIIPYLRGEETYNVALTFPKRGKFIIREISISSYFPFYFFKRNMTLPINLEIIVYPKPIECDFISIFSETKLKIDSKSSKGTAYEGELSGVRAYREGDPLKYIHWKATAKTSSLKTKEFSPFQGTPIIINLNDFSGSLEEKISKATYSVITLSKIGAPIGLKIGEEIIKPDIGQSHLRKMLYALSLYNSE